MLEIIQIPVLNDNYIYLINDSISGKTAAVDPALAQPVLNALNERQWPLHYILNTHHHWDHVGGNQELKERTGCEIIGPKNDQHRTPGIDKAVKHNDRIFIGDAEAIIFETPGHTLGHIVYYFPENAALFCGDTLFVMGCGRLFEGTAEQMWHSLNQIKTLPGNCRIYCAHEYTQTNGQFALSIEPENRMLISKMKKVDALREKKLPTVPSTMEEELATNPFLRVDNQRIQKSINKIDSSPVEVFTEIRKLKDQF